MINLSDDVLIALISTLGTIIVAWITSRQQHRPNERDQLLEENKRLKEELRKEERKHDKDNH